MGSAEALTLSPEYVDQQLAGLESQFSGAINPALALDIGKHALVGANIQVASDYPVAINRAQLRNRAIASEANFAKEGVPNAIASGTTLPQRLELSAHGNKEARSAVDIDALTEVTEQMCKAGAVLKVTANLTEDGSIEQFGQTTEMRQRNTLSTYSLKGSALRDTIYAEGQNAFFIEEANKQGLLKDKRVVEFSLIPNDTQQALAKHGYYLREVIGIMRVTTIDKNGNCEIVSVLVGGTDQEKLPSLDTIKTEQQEVAAEKLALANRFDVATVRGVYEKLGMKGANKMSTDQLLAEPIIIDDKYDHLDVAMLFDQIASQIAGKTLFFGLSYAGSTPNKADYKAHEAQSLDFQTKLKSVSKQVANEVVSRRHEAKGNVQTGKLFREIAKNHAVSYLIKDKSADTGVFGAETFHLVAESRRQYNLGNYLEAQQIEVQAQVKARATGCPGDEETSGGLKKSFKGLIEKLMDKLLGKEDEDDSEIPDNIRCIKCKKTSAKEKVIRKDTWYCPCCHYEINVCDGTVKQRSDVDTA